MAIVELTAENFEKEVLNSELPVLVDFFAVWCGPCMAVSPIVDELGEERSDIKICKVNVDDEGDLAREFEVFSIPTLMVFRNGQEVAKHVGALDKDGILSLLGK